MRKSIIIMLLAAFAAVAVMPAALAARDSEQVRFKGKVHWLASLEYYVLIGDDGRKYHPVRPLPRVYQQDGLAVVAEVRLRPELVGSRMFGTAAEVLQIARAEKYVSSEEKEAVRLLLARMQAFNARDLAALQAVDTVARSLTRQQFEEWLGGWGNFTLHYVEAVNAMGPRPADGAVIEGICLYSRQRTQSMALSGNTQYALLKFTLTKKDGKWLLAASQPYRPELAADMEQLTDDYLKRANERFGTTDLAKWKD